MLISKSISLIVVASILIATLFAGLAAVPAAAQGDTMQFRYDAQHTGLYTAVAGVPSNGHLKWKVPTGQPVRSSPAVANGVVYFASFDTVYASSVQTGTMVWYYQNPSEGYVDSSPAVVDGVVYVGTAVSVDALNAKDGTKLWNYTTFNPMSSPMVANGAVYVGSKDGNVYALNARTGAKLWSYQTGNGVTSCPAYGRGVIYVGSYDGNVYALNAQTGAKVWSYQTGNYVTSSPAYDNGVVFVGSWDGNVYALNAQTGAKVWSYPTGDAVTSSPAVANGLIYVYVGSGVGKVYALAENSGLLNWQVKTKVYGGRSSMSSSPAIAADRLYVGSDEGNLYALNAFNGATVWGYQTEGEVFSSPAVANGVVYVGSLDHHLYAIGTTSFGAPPPATVLADLNALRTTVTRLPTSAFLPGTRVAALAVINAAELNVKAGSYGGATTLQYALLARTDGCAKQGRPDSNDWVRTCAAQGQLYPQVQHAIQELHALQGS